MYSRWEMCAANRSTGRDRGIQLIGVVICREHLYSGLSGMGETCCASLIYLPCSYDFHECTNPKAECKRGFSSFTHITREMKHDFFFLPHFLQIRISCRSFATKLKKEHFSKQNPSFFHPLTLYCCNAKTLDPDTDTKACRLWFT